MADTEVIAQFTPAVAAQISQSAGDHFVAIDRLLRLFGARLVPLHPDSDDASLNRYFQVQLLDPERAEQLVERLRDLPGTEAAYIKPHGEPP